MLVPRSLSIINSIIYLSSPSRRTSEEEKERILGSNYTLPHGNLPLKSAFSKNERRLACLLAF